MREANWDQIFQRREETHAASEERLSSVVPWEEWLTLLITMVAFLSVVQSIDSAHWVNNMPSLYPMGFAGLIAGYLLARVPWRAIWLHAIGLAVGTTLVFLQLLAVLQGGSPAARTDNMLDRMHVWWYAVTHNGISSDPLPFIVLTLVLLWLGTYISSWSIFRWRNPWFGLIPGGTALMWNISFLPGQFSYAFVVFVFAAVLLVMRLHVAKKESEWDDAGVRYPEFISVSVLNATFFVTAGLLVAVWLLPLANRSDTASQRWHDFTAPATERLAPFGRLFVGLNAKKPIEVHNLKDALALQGGIKLSGKDAVDINVTLTPEMAAFLRAQSFDQYTSNGWKVNVDGDIPLPPGAPTDVPQTNDGGARQQVTIHVKVQGGNNGVLYSLGQPLESSTQSEARVGGNSGDVTSLTPADHLKNGSEYSTTGSVSVASIEQLRAAGSDYPAWVRDRYLQVPRSVPRRVRAQARELTQGETTAYDRAVAIETYLRSFPIDYSVPAPPPGRDSVDYFLFDTHRGYFDYHASAMAIMLRALGIPARVATGYVIDPGKRQGDSNDYHLTEQNAFTWPEVYFPNIGWVEFSPTPSQPTIDRPGTTLVPQPSTSQRGLQDPIDLGALAAAGAATPADVPTPAVDAATPSGGGSFAWSTWLPVIAAVALIVTLGGAARIAWDTGGRGLDEPARLWRKTQRLARWARVGGAPSETPREFAARLRRDVRDVSPISELAAAYERSTFGAQQIDDSERDSLQASWRVVRNRLLARLLHRA